MPKRPDVFIPGNAKPNERTMKAIKRAKDYEIDSSNPLRSIIKRGQENPGVAENLSNLGPKDVKDILKGM